MAAPSNAWAKHRQQPPSRQPFRWRLGGARTVAMKTWLPLLAILAGGLLLGFVGARMVDSGTAKDSAQIGAQTADDEGYSPDSERGLVADQGMQQSAPGAGADQAAGGDQNYWPGDGEDRALGPYAQDDYFGRSTSEDGGYAAGDDDPAAPFPSAGAGSEAAKAGLAAERAARDAAQVAAAAADDDSGVRALPSPAPAASPARPPPRRRASTRCTARRHFSGAAHRGRQAARHLVSPPDRAASRPLPALSLPAPARGEIMLHAARCLATAPLRGRVKR